MWTLLRGGGDGNVLEGVGGCSVSQSLSESDSLNSAAGYSRVEVAMIRDMLRSSPSSDETAEGQSKCELLGITGRPVGGEYELRGLAGSNSA
jgi:hypothetical protein